MYFLQKLLCLVACCLLYFYIHKTVYCIVCCEAKYLDWVCYDVTHGVLLATLAAIKRSGAEFRQPVYKRRVYICAADFSLLNLPKGKSLGRSKPATNS